MLSMKKLLQFTLLFTFLLMINACRKSETEQVDVNAYNEYISMYPNTLISVTSNFKFGLKKQLENALVENNVISIQPKVEGTVVLNNNELIFTPTEKLKSNQEYNITLHLSKLYDGVDGNLKDFTVTAKTKELLFNIQLLSPQVQNKNWYAVEGEVLTSDVVETAKIASILKATYNDKNKEISVDTSEEISSKISFKIDSIKRFEDDKLLTFSWNGTPIQSTSKGKRELTIVEKITLRF